MRWLTKSPKKLYTKSSKDEEEQEKQKPKISNLHHFLEAS